MQYLKSLLSLIVLYFASSTGHAVEPIDNYYSNELETAINQAREQPHHYDYSNTYRYKRTTAQSIELNRLDYQDLDSTSIESGFSDLSESNSEQTYPDHLDPNTHVAALKPNSSSNISEIKSNVTSPSGIAVYQSRQGTISSQGIVDNSVIVSTPKP